MSAHAPQSMHVRGSMNSPSVVPNPGSPGEGWMQFIGHTATQLASEQHSPLIAYVIQSNPVRR
jgi:hypothetical protein